MAKQVSPNWQLFILLVCCTFFGRIAFAEPVPPPAGPEQSRMPQQGMIQPASIPARPDVKPAEEKPTREIFVPFDDLNVLLENQPRRVFLTRSSYEELKREAKQTPPQSVPRNYALVAADYEGEITPGRAELRGTIKVEVLGPGLYAVPLDLSGVGIRTAMLDGAAAPLGREGGKPILFVRGQGEHELVLDMTLPLGTTAAQQMLDFELPSAASGTLKLAVPGNVEVRSGASAISRSVDETPVTHFEFAVPRGRTSLVLSLNNRLRQTERVVVARSVAVDEITTAFERLHTTVSLGILHGAVDHFRFEVPHGFEVTDVATPELAQWQIVPAKDENSLAVLDVKLREPATATVVLSITAQRVPAQLEDWQMPHLNPLDTAGHVSVVGVLLDEQLEPATLNTDDLIPIDTSVLTAALPDSVLIAAPGAAAVRPVFAFYAPQQTFELAAAYRQPEPRLKVTTNLLLTLSETQQRLKGGFALLPEVEPVGELRFTLPSEWHITSVTTQQGQTLAYDRIAENDRAEVHVHLPQLAQPGQTFSIYFEAVHTPDGWLANWSKFATPFPECHLLGATRDVGAIAVWCNDDLTVRPENLEQLAPLNENEKEEYALAGVATNLAYRYETLPYKAELLVQRVQPWVTARTYSFFQLQPEGLEAHYEIAYAVDRASTQQLALSLPQSTPATLAIRGLDGVELKAYYTQDDAADAGNNTRRVWLVTLAERRQGTIRLAVDFQQSLPPGKLVDYQLPLIEAEQVVYQSGMASVEGSADLEVNVKSTARKIDVGDLADADYLPGRRLLGAFGYVGRSAEVTVDLVRHEAYPLPPTIVQRAELTTLVATSGTCQSAARFQLRTKASFLEVALPPGSTLWGAVLDGQPTKPQRDGDRLLIGLTNSESNQMRDLQVVYETALDKIGFWGDLDLVGPQLGVRHEGETQSTLVPLADLVWHVHFPSGYRMTSTSGTVFTGREAQRPLPLARLGGALYALGGGIGLPFGLDAPKAGYNMLVDSSESVTATAELPQPYYTSDDVEYYAADELKTDMDSSYRQIPATGTEFFERERGEATRPGSVMAVEPAEVPASPQPASDPAPTPRTRAIVQEEAKPVIIRGGQVAQDQVGTRRDPFGDRSGNQAGGEGEKGAGQSDVENPAVQPAAKLVKDSGWALEGISSLKIDIQEAGPSTTFTSLGAQPRLDATLVDGTRFDILSAAVIVALTLWGLWLTGSRAAVKAQFVLALLVVSSLMPLLLPWQDSIGPLCDAVFLVACLMAIYYVVAALAKVSWRTVRPWLPQRQVVAGLGLVLALVASSASAEEVQLPPGIRAASIERILEGLEKDLAPVKVPHDAVIVPYDPDKQFPTGDDAQLLVPYEKYVELWNRAYPDRPIQPEQTLPATYALAGAEYEAVLDGADYLSLTGHIDIEVFTSEPVDVALPLDGGVLAEARLDGKPARLRVVGLDKTPGRNMLAPNPAPNMPVANMPVPGPQMQQAAVPPVPPVPDCPVLLFNTSGRGRQRLELSIRLRLDRQGGWRIAGGRIPAAPATRLALTVPTADTSVRLDGVLDRATLETTKANEVISTSLDSSGELKIQWRPQVSAGQVDQSLTATSQAVFDIREDGLRLAWQADVDFGRAQRDRFSLVVPGDYLVEQVIGRNIRTWQLGPEGDTRRVEIELLKAVDGAESATLLLSRRQPLGDGPQKIAVPEVRVEGAALESGLITIRRSPRVQLRTLETVGLSRTDVPQQAAEIAARGDASQQSPLGVRAYQAFRFVSTPYRGELQAETSAPLPKADVQALMRISRRQPKLEAKLLLRPNQNPVHMVEVLLPEKFEVDHVSGPRPLEWSTLDENGRSVLHVFLGMGQSEPFSVVVRGTFDFDPMNEALPLPQIELRDVERQSGQIVVQSDPAISVQATDLAGCRSVLLQQTFGWLAADQRNLARVAFEYESPGYSATLRVVPKQPQVTVFSISNVRVTDRALEETIVLEFNVREAGIDELSFLLPSWMADARIQAPMIRQTTITPSAAGPDAPLRVSIELQDEVMGQLRVLVEHDRLLQPQDQHLAPIPVIETGLTEHRFVTLEGAGRDEIVVSSHQGLEPLGREQQHWRLLSSILGAQITQAYLVSSPDAVLRFATKERKAVETVGASIPLAQTQLVVDASGAYRGAQHYYVNNSTEQFLEVQLPRGAELWTAQVAGEPVKPVPGATSGEVRIPLVKTAVGDKDYAVVLKYGGQVSRPGFLRKINFPIMQTVNIRVEKSQVRLWLPPDFNWFDFDGTMRRVDDEADLVADFLAYRNRELDRLSQVLESNGDSYSSVRALNNLQTLTKENAALGIDLSTSGRLGDNEKLRVEISNNAKVIREVEEQIQAQQEADMDLDGTDENRRRLNHFFNEQQNGRAYDIVNDLRYNFDEEGRGDMSKASGPESGEFKQKWLDENGLRSQQLPQSEIGKLLGRDVAGKPSDGKQGEGRSTKSESYGYPSKTPQLSQPRAAGVFNAPGETPTPQMDNYQLEGNQSGDNLRERAQRYQQRLAEQAGEGQGQGQSEGYGQAPGRSTNIPLGITGSGETSGQNSNGGFYYNAPVDSPAQATTTYEITDGDWRDGNANAALGVPDAAFASLEVELPLRGQEFFFSTTGDDAAIEVRAISEDAVSRIIRLLAVLGVALAGYIVYRLARSGWFTIRTRRGAVILLIAGLLMTVCFFLPIYGLIAVIFACVLLWKFRPSAQPAV